jgi:hypothetical protein
MGLLLLCFLVWRLAKKTMSNTSSRTNAKSYASAMRDIILFGNLLPTLEPNGLQFSISQQKGKTQSAAKSMKSNGRSVSKNVAVDESKWQKLGVKDKSEHYLY